MLLESNVGRVCFADVAELICAWVDQPINVSVFDCSYSSHLLCPDLIALRSEVLRSNE